MEFHKPYYSSYDKYSSGILKKNYDEYYVDDIKIINNRGLDGDTIYYTDDEVVGVKKRSNELIPGILHLNKNQKYGFNKKNIPYYKFSSTSFRFPDFIVPSKSRLKKALYCVIKLNKWETNNKHPIGQIEYIIGAVGEIDNEINILLFQTKLFPKKQKTKYFDLLENETIDYNTYSIDPIGCKDIDDSLHFEIKDESVEIGIHIANVARVIDKLECNYYSTIYLDNKQINMLDDTYTYKHCSLGNGVNRRAISLIINYKNDEIIKYNFRETTIKNKALSYQEVDNILNGNSHNLALLYNFSKKLDSSIDSSSKMVEYFMILYNKLVAETLYNYDNNTILRTHIKNINESSISDSNLSNYLDKINQNAALYQINPDNTKHQHLELDFYTHATSPIRRYVDIINQLNIINFIENKPIFIEDKIDEINIFQKNLRKFYNYYKKLKIVFDSNNSKNYDSFIVSINQKKIGIYIPDLDIEHKFIIISKKLWDTNNIIEEENSISVNDVKYSLFDKIQIKLTPLPFEEKFSKKLNIEILNPRFTIL